MWQECGLCDLARAFRACFKSDLLHSIVLWCMPHFTGGSDNTYIRSCDNLVVHTQAFCFYKGPEAGQELFLKKKKLSIEDGRGALLRNPTGTHHGPVTPKAPKSTPQITGVPRHLQDCVLL